MKIFSGIRLMSSSLYEDNSKATRARAQWQPHTGIFGNSARGIMALANCSRAWRVRFSFLPSRAICCAIIGYHKKEKKSGLRKEVRFSFYACCRLPAARGGLRFRLLPCAPPRRAGCRRFWFIRRFSLVRSLSARRYAA